MKEIKPNLIATVKHLAETIGPRGYRAIAKLSQAASFIEAKFRSFGYSPIRQEYNYRGNSYYNISVELKGLDPSRKDVLVIGAHYDTVSSTPGADDNASGIAGTLELARLLAKNPLSRTVHFVAFTLEEPPAFLTKKMGSYVYAKGLKDRGVDVYGMISLEMIGYYSDQRKSQFPFPFSMLRWFYPDTGNFIAFVGNLSSRPFSNALANSFRTASVFPMETLNTPSFVPAVSFSDHLNFWKCGYPAMMITDTAFMRNGNYHRLSDTVETLDYEKMAELVNGLYNAFRLLP